MQRDDVIEWDGASFSAGLTVVDLADLEDPRRRLEWIDAIATFGVSIVKGVPPTYEGLRAVSDQIGIVQNTNYGTVWDIVAKDDPATLVDSGQPLRVHTDLPYRRLPPGLQFLLAAEASADGGETLLVDGYALARRIREIDRRAFDALTTQDRAFAYVSDHQRYVGGGPVIGLDARGAPEVLRHAPDLVLPMRDATERAAADSAVDLLVDVAASVDLEARVRLEPGELLVLHNHRVLHGRGPVDLSSGRRRLLGCYGSLDELSSTRRVLARSVS